MIRNLVAATDTDILRDLFARAADYILLESGRPPDDTDLTDFFTGAPPGVDPAMSLHLGLFTPDDQLIGIAAVVFGFPKPRDAYIGLLLIDPAHRGKGLGQTMLDHIHARAKARHAPRLLIAVLEANPAGQKFWQKMGFVEDRRSEPVQIGRKTHVKIRMTCPL